MKLKVLVLLFCVSILEAKKSKCIDFEIVICSYNNERWCVKNLESLAQQTYPRWHATVIIDAAIDATLTLVQSFVDRHSLHDKITIVFNEERYGSLANIYRAVMRCHPAKVIGLLDGDDWFYDDGVLERVAHVYQHEDVWLTFGSFEFYPTGQMGWVRPYSQKVISNNSFRAVPGVLPTHFKTFYAWLFRKIKLEDLLYEGKFYQVAGDVAMMFPMIEMAGRHHKCMLELNYVYNIDNPLNDFNTQLQKQLSLDQHIRNNRCYKPL